MKVRVNDVSIAFDDHGSGPAVVLIHGFPLCRRMWHPQSKALAEAGFRVVTLDLRGFGESSAPDGPYSMSLYADDVIGLMDHLKIEKAVIGGMSMGGYVLLNLLERYPDRLSAALFIVTRAGADDDAGKAKRTQFAHAVQEEGPHIVTDAFEQILFAPGTPQSRPELVEQVRGWMVATAPRGLEGGLLAMRDRKDFIPDLPLLDVPALVIGAQEDKAVPIDHSRVLERGLPRATFREIEKAGHMANLEEPEAFNGCLIEFLKGMEKK